MKMVKNIAIVACAASFMFAGVSFHMANNYSELDATMSVDTSYGCSWDLNDTTNVGFDSERGMVMSFGVGSTSLRMGWNGAETSMGLGFTWWTGGDGVNTSISTNYDMVGVGAGADGTVSMAVGFGF